MITKENVKYTAALARLHVADEKLENLTKSLSDIVKYVEQLQSLDVEHVKPTSHAIPMSNALREDVVKPSLKYKETIKVPLVIE